MSDFFINDLAEVRMENYETENNVTANIHLQHHLLSLLHV